MLSNLYFGKNSVFVINACILMKYFVGWTREMDNGNKKHVSNHLQKVDRDECII
jgi:hypothetical protein